MTTASSSTNPTTAATDGTADRREQLRTRLAAITQAEYEDSLTEHGRVAHAEFLGDRVASAILDAVNDLLRQEAQDGADLIAAALEAARAEGRREANNAISWDTTCIGCANRMDSVVVLDAILDDLQAAQAVHNGTSREAWSQALAIVRKHAGQPPE